MTLISTHAFVEIDPETKVVRNVQGVKRILAQIETKGYSVAMDKATGKEVIIVKKGNRLESITEIPQSINQFTKYEILTRLRADSMTSITKLEADDLIEQQWAEIERLRTEIINSRT